MRGRSTAAPVNARRRRAGALPGVACAAAVVLVCAAGGGCAPEVSRPEFVVSVLDEIERADPATDATHAPARFREQSRRIDVTAAIHETVGVALLLSAARRAVRVEAIEVSALRGESQTLAARRVYRLFWAHSVAAPRRGWQMRLGPGPPRQERWFDPLEEIGDWGRIGEWIEAGTSGLVWVDVTVPPGTPPGEYRGWVRIRASGRERQIPVRLHVVPFALLGEQEMRVLYPVAVAAWWGRSLGLSREDALALDLSARQPLAERAVRLVHDVCRVAREHGLEPYISDYHPRFGPGSAADWDDYVRLVEPLMTGEIYADRQPAAVWAAPVLPGWGDGWTPGWAGGRHAGEATRALARGVRALARRRGWEDKAVALVDVPRFPLPRVAQAGLEAAGTLVSAGMRRVAVGLSWLDLREWGGLEYPFSLKTTEEVEGLIPAPPARFFDPASAGSPRAAGGVWVRPDEPPFFPSLEIGTWPTDPLAVAWLADTWRVGAVWLYENGASLDNGAGPAGRDSAPGSLPASGLIWLRESRGRGQPAPTIRLKRLRRGLRDLAYMTLLRRYGRPGVADRLAGMLVRFGGTAAWRDHLWDGRPDGWIHDFEAWRLAREIMISQLSAAVGGRAGQGASDEQLMWERLAAQTRRLRMRIEGSRLVPPLISGSRGELSVWVEISNQTPREQRGLLRVSVGEAVRTAPHDGLPVRVGPESWGRFRVDVPVEAVLAGPTEGTWLRVSFDADPGPPLEVAGRLAYVPVRPVGAEVHVDGDLSEWRSLSAGVAGGFRLVGGDEGHARPIEDTEVYVSADAAHLFIAFRCYTEGESPPRVRASNDVRYDGIVPVGEDLVEIVVDPAGGATRSPGDVYHIVVKRNGVVVSEKGIPVWPPVGPHAPWPCGIRAAVGEEGGAWVAEVAVPLACWPERGWASPVWGINFARLAAGRGEYSSWSGAEGHIYSPVRMGSLIWEAAETDGDRAGARRLPGGEWTAGRPAR